MAARTGGALDLLVFVAEAAAAEVFVPRLVAIVRAPRAVVIEPAPVVE